MVFIPIIPLVQIISEDLSSDKFELYSVDRLNDLRRERASTKTTVVIIISYLIVKSVFDDRLRIVNYVSVFKGSVVSQSRAAELLF